jgi:hypothetical protein
LSRRASQCSTDGSACAPPAKLGDRAGAIETVRGVGYRLRGL